MMLTLNSDHVMDGLNTSPPTIFTLPAFRSLIGQAFKLTPLQIQLPITPEQTIYVPAFYTQSLIYKKTLILGAGFDKTGITPEIEQFDYLVLMDKLIQALRLTDIDYLEIRTQHYLPFLANEADKVELCVDINDSVDSVWHSLSTNTRKNIRRPLKRGFNSVIGRSSELLDQFYQLYQMSLHDIGSLAHSKNFFEQLLEQCHDYIEIFVGYLDGKPVVSSLSFSSKEEIYGAWSGIHSTYKKHNVFLVMLWQLVEYCAATGRKTYNLGRSSQNSNPYQFKLKLANRQQNIYYYRIATKTLTCHTSKTRQIASWLIRHSPPAVMRGLSHVLLHKFY